MREFHEDDTVAGPGYDPRLVKRVNVWTRRHGYTVMSSLGVLNTIFLLQNGRVCRPTDVSLMRRIQCRNFNKVPMLLKKYSV